MKLHLSCTDAFDTPVWQCLRCRWQLRERGGVSWFADQISGADEGFDPARYAELATVEEGSFRFQARNQMIRWFPQRYLPAAASYLELGWATGFVLQMLSRHLVGWKISATEPRGEGIEFARHGVGPTVHFNKMDVRHIPFPGELDVVGAFDVMMKCRGSIRSSCDSPRVRGRRSCGPSRRSAPTNATACI
jgi:hypothetical protein